MQNLFCVTLSAMLSLTVIAEAQQTGNQKSATDKTGQSVMQPPMADETQPSVSDQTAPPVPANIENNSVSFGQLQGTGCGCQPSNCQPCGCLSVSAPVVQTMGYVGDCGCGQIGQVVYQEGVPSDVPIVSPAEASVIVSPSSRSVQGVISDGVVTQAPTYDGAGVNQADASFQQPMVYEDPSVFQSPQFEGQLLEQPQFETPQMYAEAPAYDQPIGDGGVMPVQGAPGCAGCGSAASPVYNSAPVYGAGTLSGPAPLRGTFAAPLGGMWQPTGRVMSRVRGSFGGRIIRGY